MAGLLEGAGYDVTLDEFAFEFEFPALLQQLTPVAAPHETGMFTGSDAGDVTASVVPVDINLIPPRASTSGCEAADFAGFPAGSIALLQRGTCTFANKALNAEAAGASAVIIFNQGDSPSREGLIVGTLGTSTAVIPVVGASFAAGTSLAQPGSAARVRTIAPETRTDVNVVADLPGVNTDNVVMAGAHLDSVDAGPGINDNASGSAAILETALMLARHKPQNSLRFAWWGAEEHGLVGSDAYVAGLPTAELDRIALYLNFDMVASPNHIFMVYDAGGSHPDGSTAIENLFKAYYTRIGQAFANTDFSGRSDYLAFIEAGIPSGGLFTGAEGVKTPEEAQTWGGTSGVPYDPCYHQACDTVANVSTRALEVNSDLVAYSMLSYAYSTESVNGVPGTALPNDKLPKPGLPKGAKSHSGPSHAQANRAAS